MVADFKKDLAFANNYEKRIANHFGATLSEDRRWDIQIGELTIELKIDRYFDSKNIFIETLSSMQDNKVGGPYRSVEDHIDEFWYVFVSGDKYHLYKFEPEHLVDGLEEFKGKRMLVRNKAWTTEGYLYKREQINKLATHEETGELS